MFDVNQLLRNYGLITSHGEAGLVMQHSGGGSGGMVQVHAASLQGRGTFSTHGGAAATYTTAGGTIIGELGLFLQL